MGQIARNNPLVSFMRQPKIYISLPSRGNFYPLESIDFPESEQLAVYSMTAKDELLLNVPDALMNGQAVVDVIQNCIPQIKNAWDVPSIDLDFILLSIRLATYGEQMKTPVTLEGGIEFEYQVDIRTIMDSLIENVTWDSVIPINPEITVYVKPLTYRHITKTSVQTFETQKILQLVNNENLSDDEKQQAFKDSFKKLTEVTIDVISNSISKIETVEGATDDPEFIKEYINNVDKEIFNKIQKHLEHLKEINSIKPVTIEVTEDLKLQGVKGDVITIPLTFDPSTFFV